MTLVGRVARVRPRRLAWEALTGYPRGGINTNIDCALIVSNSVLPFLFSFFRTVNSFNKSGKFSCERKDHERADKVEDHTGMGKLHIP